MVNQWFKLYGGEYLSDPKIASLTPQERSCWITLLCLASLSTIPGEIEYLTIETLLEKSGIVWDPYNPDEWDQAKIVLDKLSRLKMIERDEDGTITIKNWTKRQETNLTNAERQARFRAKSRDSNAPHNKSNARVEENRVDKSNNYIGDLKTLFNSKITLPKNENTPLLELEREKFIEYWSEKSEGGRKQRWEFEKVFDVNRRWRTWLRNVQKKQDFVKKEPRDLARTGGMRPITKEEVEI